MEVNIHHLSKRYRGDVHALRGIDLQLGTGMFGLLGPNGAGKTTLMRIMATLLPPTKGNILVNDISVRQNPQNVRPLLGYLPQTFNIYPQLKVGEFLDYLALLSGLEEGRGQRVTAVLEQVNLSAQKNRRTSQLSGGMKRRLGIAQALLNDPQLLIVDEPTAGLDPAERVRFRNLLATLSGDRIVILSTHIVEDVASTCYDLAVLHQGQLLLRGTPADLTNIARHKVWTMTVSQQAWTRLQEQYRILSAIRLDSGWQVRLLAEEAPTPAAVASQPAIEDGYIYLMQEAKAA